MINLALCYECEPRLSLSFLLCLLGFQLFFDILLLYFLIIGSSLSRFIIQSVA
uniref:Uncharacterized protein n=1 Tax=Rhizophora mucronata TaxID=61149 RepID=A0A2P2NRV9_RHIMU